MTIAHHINDDLLKDYAAGSLPEAFNLVIASHVSVCDECRARLATFELMAGEVLEAVDTAEMTAGALSSTMELITNAAWSAQPTNRRDYYAANSPFPAPLQDYAGATPDDVRWRSLGGGVRQAVLKTAGEGTTARLLRIPAGAEMPDHTHGGLEMTMVLCGAFRDGDQRFGPGDVEIADEHLEHRPVAEPGEDCICLAATDARLKFKNLLPRLAGRVMGI